MNIRGFVFAALTCACGFAHAHDYDLVENELGDSRLATLGGYTLARPISITLLNVTNEAGEVTSYSIGARIVYKDHALLRPDETDWARMQATGELLNAWLADYVRGVCAGADLDALCESYLRHEFAPALQDGFPPAVAARLEQLPAGSISVEAVTIDMLQAEGAFKRELSRRLKASKDEL